MIAPLLGPASLELLRSALSGYTPDSVAELLGADGRAAHRRGDLDGVRRAVDAAAADDERLATLVRLLLLGHRVDESRARVALRPLDSSAAAAVVERDAAAVRARVEIRPYGEEAGAGPWWVVSDFGSDVTGAPVAPDHVLGIGSASLTLAQAVPREPIDTALDLGTGCGVQALHLSAHAATVVASDVNERALTLAATTAALSRVSWDLRAGSLLDPLAPGERFDRIVANPPFVVSPGLDRASGGYDYRDSGLSGDGVSEALLRGLPGRLAAGGCASVLANWRIDAGGDWASRVAGWLDGAPCDAWVWQREVVEPGRYVSLWLRDAGETPGTPRWTRQYDRWLDWFAESGTVAVGMGLVTMWHSDRPTGVVCEDVPQLVEQPAGAHLGDWVRRRRWLAEHDDDALLSSALRCGDDVVRTREDLRTEDGWQTAGGRLRQQRGMRWEVDIDDPVAAVVAACSGDVPLGVPVEMLSVLTDRPAGEVVAALLPVVRDLVGRGFLVPADR